MTEELSKSGLTKFGQASSNNEQNIIFSLIFAFYKLFLDLKWMTASAENIVLAIKRKLGPK